MRISDWGSDVCSSDLPERLGWSHLVVARAGASTIAELTAAGRPAILVPLHSAMDDHQTANVREMVERGGARAIPQSKFTHGEIATKMQTLATERQEERDAGQKGESRRRNMREPLQE